MHLTPGFRENYIIQTNAMEIPFASNEICILLKLGTHGNLYRIIAL